MGSVARVVSSVIWLSVIGTPAALGQVASPTTAVPFPVATPPPLSNFVPPPTATAPPPTTIAPPSAMPAPAPPPTATTPPEATPAGPEPAGSVEPVAPGGDTSASGEPPSPGEAVVTPANPTTVTPAAGGGED